MKGKQNQLGMQDIANFIDYLPRNTFESMADSFESGFNEAATMQMENASKVYQAKNLPGPVLSVDQLKERYPDSGINWAEPINDAAAEEMVSQRRKEQTLQKRLESGPDGYLNTGLNFGSTMLAHMVDPAELSLTALTSGAFKTMTLARYGEKAVESAGWARVIERGALEGMATQAVLEPITAYKDSQFNEDYNATKFLSNTIQGAVFGTLFEGAAYGLSKLSSKAFRTDAGHLATDHVEASKTLLFEHKPEIIEQQLSAEIDRAAANSVEPRVKFDPNNPEGYKVYVGSLHAVEGVHQLPHDGIGLEGFTNHKGLANADAGTMFKTDSGKIFQLELGKSAKILSFDAVMSNPMRGDLTKILKKVISDYKAKPDDIGFGKATADFFEHLIVKLKTKEIGQGTFNEFIKEAAEDAAKMGKIGGIVKSVGNMEKFMLRHLENELEDAGFHGVHVYDQKYDADRIYMFKNSYENNGQGNKRIFKVDAEGKPMSVASDPDISHVIQPTSEDAARIVSETSKPLNPIRENDVPLVKEIEESITPIDLDESIKSAEKKLDEETVLMQERINYLKQTNQSTELETMLSEWKKQVDVQHKSEEHIENLAKHCVGKNG